MLRQSLSAVSVLLAGAGLFLAPSSGQAFDCFDQEAVEVRPWGGGNCEPPCATVCAPLCYCCSCCGANC